MQDSNNYQTGTGTVASPPVLANEEPVPFWDFQPAIAASVGLPVKPEEIKVLPIWVAYIIATIAECVSPGCAPSADISRILREKPFA